MIEVVIDRDDCTSCSACWERCPDFFEQNPDDEFSQIVEKYRQTAWARVKHKMIWQNVLLLPQKGVLSRLSTFLEDSGISHFPCRPALLIENTVSGQGVPP